MQINENFYFRFLSFCIEYSHVNKILWNLIRYLIFTDEKSNTYFVWDFSWNKWIFLKFTKNFYTFLSKICSFISRFTVNCTCLLSFYTFTVLLQNFSEELSIFFALKSLIWRVREKMTCNPTLIMKVDT